MRIDFGAHVWYTVYVYMLAVVLCLQCLKHHQYSKNAIKFPPPKSEKGGEKRKKVKKFFLKSGGQTLI